MKNEKKLGKKYLTIYREQSIKIPLQYNTPDLVKTKKSPNTTICRAAIGSYSIQWSRNQKKAQEQVDPSQTFQQNEYRSSKEIAAKKFCRRSPTFSLRIINCAIFRYFEHFTFCFIIYSGINKGSRTLPFSQLYGAICRLRPYQVLKLLLLIPKRSESHLNYFACLPWQGRDSEKNWFLRTTNSYQPHRKSPKNHSLNTWHLKHGLRICRKAISITEEH